MTKLTSHLQSTFDTPIVSSSCQSSTQHWPLICYSDEAFILIMHLDERQSCLNRVIAHQPHEGSVLVAVADQERPWRGADHGQGHQQLRPGTHFEAIVERPAGFQDALDERAVMIALHRKHARVHALHRGLEFDRLSEMLMVPLL